MRSTINKSGESGNTSSSMEHSAVPKLDAPMQRFISVNCVSGNCWQNQSKEMFRQPGWLVVEFPKYIILTGAFAAIFCRRRGSPPRVVFSLKLISGTVFKWSLPGGYLFR